jgi:hypothetical protein
VSACADVELIIAVAPTATAATAATINANDIVLFI